MARARYNKRNLNEAQDYLREAKKRYPEIERINPQAESTILRYANKYSKMEAAGVTPDPRIGRGHGTTPEHRKGKPPKLSPEHAAYVEQSRRVELPTTNIRQFKTGNFEHEVHTKEQAQRFLRSSDVQSRTIKTLSIQFEGGYWRSIKVNLSTDDLKKKLESGMTWKAIAQEYLDQQYSKAKATGHVALYVA